MKNVNVILRHYSKYSKVRCMAKILRSVKSVPKENLENRSTCKSLKLMLKQGLISSASPGIFNLMPLAVISLEKLCKLIDVIMNEVGGQKCLFPTLTHSSLWKTSGRWDAPNTQLFKLQDRHSVEYCLGPTHEEAVTAMVKDVTVSLKTLPLRLYQISTKYRDEVHPKLGLLRGREFLMKDMYTFDSTEDEAKKTYCDVCSAYDKLFDALGVPYVKVEGSSAGMGGTLSHEYHYLSPVGEDEILYCPKCHKGMNAELSSDSSNCSICNTEYDRKNGIEVGHAFLLGTTYTEPFEAKFKTKDTSERVFEMGCYGLGVTRILAASIECLSHSEILRWPIAIAPFLISVIPPKKGSKEEFPCSQFTNYLIDSLSTINGLSTEIVMDDRTNLSIGKRVQDANSLGIPYSLVVSDSALQDVPKVELISNYNEEKLMCNHSEITSFFRSSMINETKKICALKN